MFDFRRPTYKVQAVDKTDADYPKSLLCLGDDAPDTLYCIGDKSLLNQPIATVVGNQMTSSLMNDTDNMLDEADTKYSIINRANEGVEYYSINSAVNNCHKPIIMLSGTYNVDDIEYDEFRPLLDDVINAGGLVLSVYEDSNDFIDMVFNFNHIMVMLSDVVYCPRRDSNSLYLVKFAKKVGKQVVEF